MNGEEITTIDMAQHRHQVDGGRFVNLTGERMTLLLSNNRYARLDPVSSNPGTRWTRVLFGRRDPDIERSQIELSLEGDLPSPQEGIILIVRDRVARFAWKRKDVFAPEYTTWVDETGARIVGSLYQYLTTGMNDEQ